MPNSSILADRLRLILASFDGITEREKMGGLSFMLGGKVCARVEGGNIIVRCQPEDTDALLAEPGISRYTMTGKEAMKGWLAVSPEALAEGDNLDRWVTDSAVFVGSLA
jgi:TfoX/Sxy family transcriptional regulator of competence genes